MCESSQSAWEARTFELLTAEPGIGYRSLHARLQEEKFNVGLKKVQKFATSQRSKAEQEAEKERASARHVSKPHGLTAAGKGMLDTEYLYQEWQASREKYNSLSERTSSAEWLAFFVWVQFLVGNRPSAHLDSDLADATLPDPINAQLLGVDRKIEEIGIVCPPEPTPLNLGCAMGHVKIVELLLKHRADPSVCGGMGFSPLHTMCSSRSRTHEVGSAGRDDLAIANALLHSSHDPNIADKMSGSPLLVHAASCTSAEVLRLLVAWKADVSSRSLSQEATALHTAACNGNSTVIAALLELRADPCSKNYEGETPSEVAATKGHSACVAAFAASIGT